MTNEVNYAPVRYGCNGVNVDFSFPWKIFENEDIIVQIQNKEGNISTLAYGVDYTVEFEAMGGNVKLKNVYSEDNIVIISRDVSDYQSKSFSTSPGFQASEIEKSLDRVSCNLQEMSYNIENFKKTYSAEIDLQIEALENVIEENKQEVLLIQERYEDNLNNQIIELKTDVDNKVKTVASAADKINKLDESIALCQSSAEIATEQATIATQKAEEITEAKEQINNKADKIDVLSKTNITNCITSIPQRIKLDLVDGVLILKAGSIVTIPNGFEADETTPKYNYLTIENDISGEVNTSGVYLFSLSPSLALGGRINTGYVSSNTEPTNPTQAQFWYDTKNNIVKRYLNNAWNEGWSLPICEVTAGQLTNTFNGVGYIGSTVWVDKGVKYLIPNGRNEDGSLNNVEHTLTNLVRYNNVHEWGGRHKLNMLLTKSTLGGQDKVRFSVNKIIPTGQTVTYSFSEQDNFWYYTNDAGANWSIYQGALIGSLFSNSNDLSISEFQIKEAFRALDYNDKPDIIAWGMPSTKSIALAVGASKSTYIMPANGFLNVGGHLTTTTVPGMLQLTGNGLNYMEQILANNSTTFRKSIPVKKGDSIYFSYDNLTIDLFNFVYAQGEVA